MVGAFTQSLISEAAITGPSVDITGLQTGDISFTPVPSGADHDADGWPDLTDVDDDNDGIHDEDDAFPHDNTESLDTDGDGIGNNADEDDDNDGVNDDLDSFPLDSTESTDTDADGTGEHADVYPADAACAIETDGDGANCYATIIAQEGLTRLKQDDDKVVYFYLLSTAQILRFNGDSTHFISPLTLAEGSELTDFIAVEQHDRVYIAHENTIQFIDATSTERKRSF